jgi:hypothetical protein
MSVMSDVDEDNFDRAFDLIRPGESRSFPLQLQIMTLECSDTRNGRCW